MFPAPVPGADGADLDPPSGGRHTNLNRVAQRGEWNVLAATILPTVIFVPIPFIP